MFFSWALTDQLSAAMLFSRFGCPVDCTSYTDYSEGACGACNKAYSGVVATVCNTAANPQTYNSSVMAATEVRPPQVWGGAHVCRRAGAIKQIPNALPSSE